MAAFAQFWATSVTASDGNRLSGPSGALSFPVTGVDMQQTTTLDLRHHVLTYGAGQIVAESKLTGEKRSFLPNIPERALAATLDEWCRCDLAMLMSHGYGK